MNELSPVALFVYNRADNTERTLRALLANSLAPHTDLYVFSDGGRDEKSWKAVREVRALLHTVEAEVLRARTLNNITIVERPENYYLERNIIEGINQVLEHHETVIVLEDDIVTAPHFLEFMNDAFRIYKDDKRVMHVSGFTRLTPDPSLQREGSIYRTNSKQQPASSYSINPNATPKHQSPSPNPSLQREGSIYHTGSEKQSSPTNPNATPKHHTPLPLEGGDGGGSYFSPFMAGWGWGTWRDRWNGHFLHFSSRAEALEGISAELLNDIEYGGVFPCLKDLNRSPIPWDICWAITIRRAGGLCLYPTHTLVRNIGLDGGTHYRNLPRWVTRLIQRYEYDRPPYEGRIEVVAQEPIADPDIEAQMKAALTDWGIRYTWFGRLLRRIFAGH